MAPFNPQIQPTNDPNYEGRSRPIDIPDSIKPRGVEENRVLPKGQEVGDRSAEFEGKAAAYASESEGSATKGFGDLFAGIVGMGDFAAKAGVQLVKKDIEDRVYEVADAERTRYTQELQNIKAGGGTKTLIMDANASEDDTPDEVQGLPSTLETLTSARNAGKISNTDYVARLNAAAKDIRARYPGFRQEIDQEFAKVTGMNPANAYINKLITDINRQQTSANSDKNKLLGYIRSRAGYEDSEEMYKRVESGMANGNDVMRWAAPQERLEILVKQKKAVFDSNKMDREEQQRNGRELFDVGADVIVEKATASFMKEMGITSEQAASEIDTRTKNGGIKSERWSEIGQVWADRQLELRNNILTQARKTGLVRALGIDEVNKRTDEVMKRMAVMGDRIFNKDSGGIYKTQQWTKALGDEDQKALLSDSIVGTDFRAIETIKRIGGEQFLQSENLRKLTNGLSGRFQNYQERMVKAIQTQEDQTKAGVPVTLNRIFDEFNVKMKTATDTEKRKMNASMIDEISRIADPNVPDAVKLNYARSAFDPANQGFINRLNIDSVDERGRRIEGQNAVFQKLTNAEITKEMKRLGEKNPEIWKNYTDWTTKTLANDLLSKEFAKLGEIRNPAIRVGWDSDNKRFKDPEYLRTADPTRNTAMQSPVADQELSQVQRAVSRINANLSNYKNVAEASGKNVEAFMLGAIVNSVGPQSLSQVDNIPGDVMRQIGLTQLKKKGPGSH